MPLPQSISLPDSRTLCFAEYGSAEGTPVLFFHGFPGSHKEAAIWHSAAVRHSVRLISADRPGIGLSSYQRDRVLLDWPADMDQLARHLGLDLQTVPILAVAGGGPHALALLHAASTSTKKNRSGKTAIVSGLYPLSLGASSIRLPTRITLFLVGYIWWLLVPIVDWALGKPARQNPQVFYSRMMREAEGRPMVDRKLLDQDKQYTSDFLESARHAFAQDARGFLHEAGLMGRAWGFDLAEISPKVAQNITIWQGGFDNTCPVDLARKAHERMSASTLRVKEYEGHLSMSARRQDEILGDLLQD